MEEQVISEEVKDFFKLLEKNADECKVIICKIMRQRGQYDKLHKELAYLMLVEQRICPCCDTPISDNVANKLLYNKGIMNKSDLRMKETNIKNKLGKVILKIETLHNDLDLKQKDILR